MAVKKHAVKPRSKARSKTAPTKVQAAFEAIYLAVARIPRGRVATYGGIARLAGLPRRARLVGTALKNAPASRRLPWHRVITAAGVLAFPEGSEAFALQSSRLRREGVTLRGRRVSLSRYGWPQEDKSLDELLWSGD